MAMALVSLGLTHAAIAVAGKGVVAWGATVDNYGQATVPTGLSNVVAMSAGSNHNLALKSDGTVVAWGRNEYGQTNVPAGLNGVVAIAAGNTHNLALKSDGTVVGWGYSCCGQINVPAGLNGVMAIAAAGAFSLALKSDGTVVGWGYNNWHQTNPPAGLGNVVAIAAGSGNSLALKSDGTVVAWGDNSTGLNDVPVGLSGVVAIAASVNHALALRSDGTVVGWGGFNRWGENDPPAGLDNVAAIATGGWHSLALKWDGTVVAWGWNGNDQTSVPAGLSNVVAIAGGAYHTLALQDDDASPPTAAPTVSPGANANGWNNTDATVHWNWTDNAGGSGVDSANCTTGSTSSGEGSALTLSATCKDLAGNAGSASYAVKVDKTNPTVTYGGNAGVYSVDATINITCTAADALSGTGTSTCSNISGSAYEFGLGTRTFSDSATDNAGNSGVGSTTFTVVLTPEGLEKLIIRFFGSDTLGANGLIAKVSAISSARNANSKAGSLAAFSQQVDAKIGNPLTAAQGALLKSLASSL